MTDDSRDRGRIDLRALDAPDPTRADRVLAGTMARLAERRAVPPDPFIYVVRFSRPLLVAAAVLVVAAMGTLVLTRARPSADQPASVLAGWVESNHVPTDGELLATFQGYQR